MSAKKVNRESGPQSQMRVVASPKEQFQHRESNELVLAFSGPLGSGIELVINQAEEILKGIGYSVSRIKLSDFIKELYAQLPDIGAMEFATSGAERFEQLQDAGNELRRRYQADILAEAAIAHISQHRLNKHYPQEVDEIVPGRVVYIIDQLKHPAEVDLLRSVYGNLFYLVGVLCSYEERKAWLVDRGIDDAEADRLMKRDRREDFKLGQQLDKTLELSDLFVRNSSANSRAIDRQLTRFFDLVHGKQGISPTRDESGMYAAYSASLRSLCLSRQVGAAITDAHGNLLATGCNDVPKSGGGLYGAEDDELDQRCVNIGGGKCFNVHHKLKLRDELKKVVYLFLKPIDGSDQVIPDEYLEKLDLDNLAEQLYSNTRLSDLLEFSRSVHAEMDAITSVARMGRNKVKNSTLYTTTFPCHNCARHIIASGVKRVVYIEPYEKSLAKELHGDAIQFDPPAEGPTSKTVFVHFEGIAPNRFKQFFRMRSDRKGADGAAVKVNVRESRKVTPQYLDKYTDLESKVVAHLQELNLDPSIFSGDG